MIEELSARASRVDNGATHRKCVRADSLSEHAKRNAAGKASVRVLRDGKLLATLAFSGAETKSFRRTLAELPAGEITLEPSGPVYVALRQRRVSEVTDNAPIERGFTLKRTYEDLATGQVIDQVKPGQLVNVRPRWIPSVARAT